MAAWTVAALVLAAGLDSPAIGQTGPGLKRSGGCGGSAFDDTITRLGTDGDVHLASGRRLRMVDLRLGERRTPTPAGPPASDPAGFFGALEGTPVRVTPAGPPDRWDRVPASVALAGTGSPIDLAELLVSEGLALVDAGERDALCRPDLLRLEAIARRHRRGLWSDTRPLPAGEPEAVRTRTGGFALLRGRVVSVGERRDRTYLNFGRDFTRDVSVVLTKRGWAALKDAGHDAASLRGRVVQVRGLIEARRGPTVEIAAAELVEIDPVD